MYGKVSVILPNYNCGKFIGETIESVIAQTYDDWELLIVDDCSSDCSVEIVKGYCEKDDRIKLYRHETNKGGAAARNLALREASGRWVAFLDSDDLWLPQKLEKQLRFMIDNNYRFCYTAYEQIDEEGRYSGVLVTGPKKVTERKMLRYCYPGCLTVVYDSSEIGTVQIPDEIGTGENDYALWLRVCKHYTCYYFAEALSLYRVRGNSMSHKSSLFKLIGNHYKLFRISEKRGVIGAMLCVIRNLWYGFLKKRKYVKKRKRSVNAI